MKTAAGQTCARCEGWKAACVSQESCLEPPKGARAPEPGAVGCVPGCGLAGERPGVPAALGAAAAAVPQLWLLLGTHGHE